jgi:muramidase (phage lysozyme)
LGKSICQRVASIKERNLTVDLSISQFSHLNFMTSKAYPDRPSKFKNIAAAMGGIILLLSFASLLSGRNYQGLNPIFNVAETPPLVMPGGDPYIRALMRMISASESNDSRPYSVLYGGTHVDDLSHHPEKCIRIVNGPNTNNCSTAAGRYQMINTTWATMAKKYHPQHDCMLFVLCHYSFEPKYQDKVVHAWLSDEKFWGMNISQNLKDGQLELVRKRLSSTWTSLGYGIETNSRTSQLSDIYQRLVDEELKRKA